jgi:hypothetical protein
LWLEFPPKDTGAVEIRAKDNLTLDIGNKIIAKLSVAGYNSAIQCLLYCCLTQGSDVTT